MTTLQALEIGCAVLLSLVLLLVALIAGQWAQIRHLRHVQQAQLHRLYGMLRDSLTKHPTLSKPERDEPHGN